MKAIVVALFLLVCASVHAQPAEFCQEALWYKKYKAGESLTISCDTVYLLNRYTFLYYQKLYRATQTQDQRVKSLTAVYGDMTNLYEKRIASQNDEYNRLRKSFDDLTAGSQKFIERADKNLEVIRTSLSAADKNIQSAQVN